MEENQNVSTNTNSYNNYGPMKEQDDVVSMWAFMGLQLLYCIPCIGFICMIVFACGAIKNKNIKNHARSILLIYAVIFVLYLILFFCGVGAGLMSALTSGY